MKAIRFKRREYRTNNRFKLELIRNIWRLEQMKSNKTEVLYIRITPELKTWLTGMAEQYQTTAAGYTTRLLIEDKRRMEEKNEY